VTFVGRMETEISFRQVADFALRTLTHYQRVKSVAFHMANLNNHTHQQTLLLPVA